jgi:hypothetical protein
MLEEEMDFDKGFIHRIYEEKTIQVKHALETKILSWWYFSFLTDH